MSSHHDRPRLARDLEALGALTRRRQFLQLLACASLVPLLGCASEDSPGASADGDQGDGGTSTTPTTDSCAKIPEETAGPYPADGSNGVNALALSGIVRSDIRSSIAGASATAEGITLTVELTLVNVDDGCRKSAGYAVYLWHCDREGRYSLYSAGVTEQNYLRGVQESDEEGTVTFTTIFPGCYAGRMPHIHFEVYSSLDVAIDAKNKLATSQLAFPLAPCNEVFATSGYEASVANLSAISFSSDNVFRDGTELQLANVTGGVEAGYVATLTVGVSG